MKGVVCKYYPLIDDPDLRDEMGRVGCFVANPDPDFWDNPFPIWAICGPYVRSTLEPEDVLFFTPVIRRSRAAGIPDYICTGYLTVDEILPNRADLERHPKVTSRYKRNYRSDLSDHQKGDIPLTRRLRPRNIVIGDRNRSRWYGKSGQSLDPVLRRASTRNLDLKLPRVQNLTVDEAEKLRAALMD